MNIKTLMPNLVHARLIGISCVEYGVKNRERAVLSC